MGLLRKISLLAICLTATMALPTNENERALQEVTHGAGQFSSAFYQAIVQEEPGNLVVSPLSVSVVLSMAAYGAAGNTLTQLSNVLHLPKEESVGKAGFSALIHAFNNVEGVELKLANKVFVNHQFSIKPDYKQVTETNFYSAGQEVNFGDSQKAADIINAWCKEQTNNRIDGLIEPSALNPLTALVLVNAVYFKGNWKLKFNPRATTNRDFHVSPTAVKSVPTMYKKDDLVYGELPELKAKFVELPYQGEQVSMIIIVPNEVDGLSELERKLQNVNLSVILAQGHKREVEVYLPKFKVEYKKELNEVLKNLGLTDMFSRHADFSRISDAELSVSQVVQKAFIEVNEEGSEAAAATGLTVVAFSLIHDQELFVDRPFFYSIALVRRDDQHKVIGVESLFQGHVKEPVIE